MSGIGGQAVMEGVMMKNQDKVAIAVRKPDGEIEIKQDTFRSLTQRNKFFGIPILRGMVTFVESLTAGMKALAYSSSFYEEDEVSPTKFETAFNRIFKEKADAVMMALAVLFSILLTIGLFVLVPFVGANFLDKLIESAVVLSICEGALRLALFIVYVLLISQMNDIKRVFMYHGAEHKTINCIEHGYELTVENVRIQSKEHKRCGTSFMVYVLFFSIVFFTCIQVENYFLKMVLRLLLIPVIAGVSYEFIRFAGKSNSKIMHILSRPGMWVQGLTTKEPDDAMIEVAIRSVDSVFDWKTFVEGFNGQTDEVKPKRRGFLEDDPVTEEDDLDEIYEEEQADEEMAVVTDSGGQQLFNDCGDIMPGFLEEEKDDVLDALDRYFERKEKK
jgi:uncharacterized protein YqhQ